MNCSVVIRSLNEADRLRLTLASLERQTETPEVVVVDDGSSDHTSQVIEQFRGRMTMRVLRHSSPKGRSAASNAGAFAATGDLLVFLDGDTLAHPALVERHLAAHTARPGLLGRGETLHLRCTRFLQDPETVTPWPSEATRIDRISSAERERMRVTSQQIAEDFEAIERRAAPGIYPGAGPRALFDLEVDALRNHPDCTVLWVAASGANFSVDRIAFRESGGFDDDIDINEHREAALRLCAAGGRMGLVEGARSFHLTHRTGWRDPLRQTDWEAAFYRRHPILAVKLLAVFWASLAENSPVPPEARIVSLPDLERRALGTDGIDYDAVRELIAYLQPLVDTR